MKNKVVIVLVRPRFPENIGATARVVACLGFGDLRVVEPQRLWDDPMKRMATSHAWHILENMRVFDDLAGAIQDCNRAVATTARVGYRRGDLINPRQMSGEVLGWLEKGRLALVFGPEDRGLTNQELDMCFPSVRIPVEEGSSLNLAQAVMVMGHEVRMALDDGHYQRPRIGDSTRRPANLGELQGLFKHLSEAFVELGVVAKENPPHFFRPYKELLERASLTSREVRALHGVARQVLWICGKENRGFDPSDVDRQDEILELVEKEEKGE